MFHKFDVFNNNLNLFTALAADINFEEVAYGRKGAILVEPKTGSGMIPIVRSTTVYQNPAQKFPSIYQQLIKNIQSQIETKFQPQIESEFQFTVNNAMIEIYDTRYTTMKYHSDQALDLEDNSYIAIFSCYYPSDTKFTRSLLVKPKLSKIIDESIDKKFNIDNSNSKLNENKFNLPISYEMTNNSVILFSTKTNKQYLHKIILNKSKISKPDDKTQWEKTQWLGITFRLSKKYIPPDLTNNIFHLASDEEKNEFYKLRKQENFNINFKYPEINYTISPSDLKAVVDHNHHDLN